MVFVANDVSPAEVIMHLPLLCKEKKIPVSFVETKKELGEKVGIAVGAAAVVVLDAGEAQKEMETIAKRVMELSK
jgi:large subunit ribosomal protein L7Ae